MADVHADVRRMSTDVHADVRECPRGWAGYIYTVDGDVCHSVVSLQRVKMDDTTLLHYYYYQPESLKVCSFYALTRTIILNDIVPASCLHQILSPDERDDSTIDRLVVNCPGNRFDICTGWQNFHVSCFVSRAYQMLWDKLLSGMDLMCNPEIEDIRNKVEDKFKIRLLSCIDAVNKCRDDKIVCMRYHDPYKTKCVECLYYVMLENVQEDNRN